MAWVGVVPFMLEGLKARGLPAVPALSSFPELNVRTYVTLDGKPGVYFFSLDAASKLAVMAARTLFHLNYLRAEMNIAHTATGIEYSSKRIDARGRPACFRAHYTAIGEVEIPQPGTREHFLTERYCLYSVSSSGAVYRLEIHHRPWLLQAAEAELDARDMLTAAGLSVRQGTPLLHFSSVQKMIGWASEKLGLRTRTAN